LNSHPELSGGGRNRLADVKVRVQHIDGLDDLKYGIAFPDLAENG